MKIIEIIVYLLMNSGINDIFHSRRIFRIRNAHIFDMENIDISEEEHNLDFNLVKCVILDTIGLSCDRQMEHDTQDKTSFATKPSLWTLFFGFTTFMVHICSKC